jgi:signal transduction histidine kinase
MTDDITVLLVDDENNYRQVLSKRLSRRGIQVSEARSGEEALQVLEVNPVEIVVLDVKMPGMNGIECLRHIRDQHPAVEVIMLTGHADISGGVEGIKSGAFDYLAKPIEIEHLIRKLHQAHNKLRRGRAEKQEKEFKERIKQQMVVAERLVALGTMATGVAHEINNPLAVIQESVGWMQQILAKSEKTHFPRAADFDKGLDRIQKAVSRASRITQQLLQAVRTQTTEMVDPSTFVDVSLKELIDEAITLVETEAALKDITLQLESDEPYPMAWTDPLQLLQVLLNLLTNSIQATDVGGRVTILLKASMEEAKIVIQDTGCGISKENMTRIFEPFFTTK